VLATARAARAKAESRADHEHVEASSMRRRLAAAVVASSLQDRRVWAGAGAALFAAAITVALLPRTEMRPLSAGGGGVPALRLDYDLRIPGPSPTGSKGAHDDDASRSAGSRDSTGNAERVERAPR
jgi:hypothetical protein